RQNVHGTPIIPQKCHRSAMRPFSAAAMRIGCNGVLPRPKTPPNFQESSRTCGRMSSAVFSEGHAASNLRCGQISEHYRSRWRGRSSLVQRLSDVALGRLGARSFARDPERVLADLQRSYRRGFLTDQDAIRAGVKKLLARWEKDAAASKRLWRKRQRR